jgi:hypothetical protein
MLRQGSLAIRDHADTVVHNINADSVDHRRFERMATQVDVDPGDAADFAKFLADRGQAFLEEMDQWLAQRQAGAKHADSHRRAIRTGVGMYLIYDETQGIKNNG